MSILLSQGAEGKIFIGEFLSKKCVVKERFVKKYRVKELDQKLTKNRMLNESKNIARASKLGINVPTLYFVDLIERKIYMEYLENSCQLKVILQEIYSKDDISQYKSLIDKISNDLGNMISNLHSGDLIHGDLTPSNIILKIKEDTNSELLNNAKEIILKNKNYDYMYLIDFGLSSVALSTTSGIEDKAVDLYVLKRAIISSNPKSEDLFEKAMDIYKKNCKNGKEIIERYKKVEMRGRKKLCFG
jgi:TP53 regulating kinase-like protein